MDTLANKQLEEKIFVSLSQYAGKKISKLDMDSKIMDDLGLDSFSIVELLYELEMEHGLKVSNESLKKIITVKDLFNCINGPKGNN